MVLVKGDLKGPLVQSSAMDRDTVHYPRVLQPLALNTSRDAADATSLRASSPSQGEISY